MSINLIKALVATLESAHRIATELENAAENERKSEVANALGSFLSAIKSSGSGETSAKDETDVAAEAPVTEAPVAEDAVEDNRTVAQKLTDLLNDERFTLRTASALIEESGFEGDQWQLIDYLEDDLELDIVRKNRRSDSALLIGLESRN